MKIRTLHLFYISFFLFINTAIFAQIGINATGASPSSNAMIDVSSTTKGALLPRMSSAQRAALTTSDGLTVYDTDTKSYWFVKGSVWTEMVGGAGGDSGPWQVAGNNIYNTNTGNVGIGVTNPEFPLVTKGRIGLRDAGSGESAGIWFNNIGNTALNTFIGIDPNNRFGIFSYSLFSNIFYANMANGNIGIGLDPGHKLHIGNNPVGSTAGLRVEGPLTTGGYIASFGGFGDFVVDKPGVVGGRFIIKNGGNVGIGNNNPNSPLSFNNAFGDKISLLDNGAGNRYNISVNPSDKLYFSTPGTSIELGRDISFGHSTSTGNYWERFNIKANGALAVNGSEGTSGQILMSKGSANPAGWVDLSKIQHIVLNEVSYLVANNNVNNVTGATINFTAPVNGKLIIWSNFKSLFGCANPIDHCYLVWQIKTLLDGNIILTSDFQTTYAYLQPSNNDAIAPISIDVSAGVHTISFTETLTSIAPLNPTIYIRSYAQFIPN